MGIDYGSVCFVGKVFGDDDEAEKYFTDKVKLTDDQLDEIEEDGFADFIYDYDPNISGGCLNSMTGYGFWIGVPISYGEGATQTIVELTTARNHWMSQIDDEPEFLYECTVS